MKYIFILSFLLFSFTGKKRTDSAWRQNTLIMESKWWKNSSIYADSWIMTNKLIRYALIDTNANFNLLNQIAFVSSLLHLIFHFICFQVNRVLLSIFACHFIAFHILCIWFISFCDLTILSVSVFARITWEINCECKCGYSIYREHNSPFLIGNT